MRSRTASWLCGAPDVFDQIESCLRYELAKGNCQIVYQLPEDIGYFVLYDVGNLLATIERAAHLVGTYVERAAGELRVTQAEAHVLAQLARQGPVPIAALHREFGRKRSTLTNILDRLEQRKLVRRELNRQDRRSFIIHLTAAGTQAASRITRVLDELERELCVELSDSDLRGVDAVAAALKGAVQRHLASTPQSGRAIRSRGAAPSPPPSR